MLKRQCSKNKNILRRFGVLLFLAFSRILSIMLKRFLSALPSRALNLAKKCKPTRKGMQRIALLSLLLLVAFITMLAWPMNLSSYTRLSPSGEMLDRSDHLIHAILNEQEQWCFTRDLNQISPHLIQATIAGEDQRFRRHHGIDFIAVCRAIWQNIRHRRAASGASTLPMQVVNLSGHRSRSISGKIQQTLSAIRLDMRLNKDQILHTYLNKAPYGLNLIGCEAAARRYFGKPSIELTLAEAALLAALPKAPTSLMPLKHPNRAKIRRDYILDRMLQENFITTEQHTHATASPLGVRRHKFPILAPHLAMRLAPRIREKTKVKTTLDMKTQQHAETFVREQVTGLGEQITNAALIVVDAPTAQVLARVGSAGFLSLAEGGQFDATRALRSPGSTLKPFTYALAMQKNRLYMTETLLDDTLDYGLYNPKNFDEKYRGLVSASKALRSSLNVPAVQVFERIGEKPLYEFLKSMGLKTLRRDAKHYGMGLTLGNCEARLDELTAAYCMLANTGEYRPLTLLDGNTTKTKRLLSRGITLNIYAMLDQPFPNEIDTDEAGIISVRPRVCWKTGTSTSNRDAWTFCFNSQFVVGVWVGNNDGSSAQNLIGRKAALPLAARMFRSLEPPNTPTWPNAGKNLRPVAICALSGLPKSRWCPHTSEILMPREQYVQRICDIHWPAGNKETSSTETTVIERWPGSARHWDLADITAPIVIDRSKKKTSTSTRGLQILSPVNGAEFVLTGRKGGDHIQIRSSVNQTQQIHWYLDDKFLGTSTPDKPIILDLKQGTHKLVGMTPDGTSSKIEFKVVEATSEAVPK